MAKYFMLTCDRDRNTLFSVSVVQFLTMNLIYFAIWQLMIIAVIGRKREPRDLNTLTLKIQFPDHVSTIKFWRVERALANEFLPVWVTTNEPGKEFRKLEIMRKVGKVSFFHDTCSKSSLVYYHSRHEIDGVFDVTYYIQRFRINEGTAVQHLDYKHLHKVNHHEKIFNSRHKRSNDNTTLIRSHRSSEEIFYIESLIAINHDTYQAIENDSKLPPGIATVSHMLTVLNAADLLYSLMPTVDIQLNIAGIVIEGIPNQWNFESEVINDWGSQSIGSSKFHVKADTMHSKISNYFWLWQNDFPRHSYDMIQYFTISSLISKTGSLHIGQAPSRILLNSYMFPPDFFRDRSTTVNKVLPSYRHFLTIAHETAHTFAVHHDGEGKLGHLFDIKSCGSSLMSPTPVCTSRCLKWSPQASQEFEDYFIMQQASCNLMNYPRSLDVPEPKIIFSAAWQCDCYGFEPVLGPSQSISEHECDRCLICKKDFRERVKVPLPMDGTPCGWGKVCWDKKCVEIKKRN